VGHSEWHPCEGVLPVVLQMRRWLDPIRRSTTSVGVDSASSRPRVAQRRHCRRPRCRVRFQVLSTCSRWARRRRSWRGRLSRRYRRRSLLLRWQQASGWNVRRFVSDIRPQILSDRLHRSPLSSPPDHSFGQRRRHRPHQLLGHALCSPQLRGAHAANATFAAGGVGDLHIVGCGRRARTADAVATNSSTSVLARVVEPRSNVTFAVHCASRHPPITRPFVLR
jgi:hypothetical protein